MAEHGTGRPMTRRALALAAASAAAASALSACSHGESDSAAGNDAGAFDPATDWLPIGSVVTAHDEENDKDWKLMIYQRKPYTSLVHDEETGKDRAATDDDPPFDYVGILFPFGTNCDYSTGEYWNDGVLFDRDKIKEVLFVGYRDDSERRCEQLLSDSDAAGDNLTASALFLDDVSAYVAVGETGSSSDASSGDAR